MATNAANLMSDADRPTRDPASRGLVRGLSVLVLALAPTLLAIAWHPGFTTQDGPAHIYSARILNAALVGNSPFAATFQVAWQPLPNWAGHALTMLALMVWSPEVANRVVTGLTLTGFATAVLLLRWFVAGASGIGRAAVLAALLALNVTWLLGFTSFLLGATLAPVTLAVWWSGREGFGLGRSVSLALLLILGYFAHPISLGLTLGGLLTLALCTPGSHRWVRAGWTALSGVPLLPLGAVYWSLTRSGGSLQPAWAHWSPSLSGVASQVGWIDPLSLAAKTVMPFNLRFGFIPNAAFAPVVWVVPCLIMLGGLTWNRRDHNRLGWLVLATGLIVAGLISPDTIGVKHGHYLPQRIELLGLVALIPWLDLGSHRFASRLTMVILGASLVIQSAFVWEYARTCRDEITPFLRVAARFERGTSAGTLLNGIRGKFRSNPLLHADGLLAARTDSTFWTNYETAQYYFPVKVRAGIDHPIATRFEEVAILDEPGGSKRRERLWSDLLRVHGPQLDKIVEWQPDARLDAITDRDYDLTDTEGPLRIWTRRASPRLRD